ncbi:MAG: MTH938/NDUFAF3 family protein [Candidatus Paceibacterota bacterium]
MQLQIVGIKWGSIELEHGYTFKDVILAPGFCQEWNWNDSKTTHSSGPQEDDINVLLLMGVDTIILSRGMDMKLMVSPEIYEYCLSKVDNVIICESKEAVVMYNFLVKSGKRVGLLLHSN